MFEYRGDDRYRLHLAGPSQNKQNGCVQLPNPTGLSYPDLRIVFASGGGWEHVSVSTETRVPTWAEMCVVKALFWDAEDCVMQLHPPKSQYVNRHPRTLHLWRPIDSTIPQPPIDFV